MNHGAKSRGLITYLVVPRSGKEAFTINLRHSRMRDASDALIAHGEQGASFYDDPAPRWASSIHKLRGMGISISTEMVRHGGAYPGKHALYRLVSKVQRQDGAGQ
jgi:hypothetical protein